MFTAAFVKEVYYHPIHDQSHICYLATKVSASMTSATYQVWVAVEKDNGERAGGRILSAYCTCTAG